MSVLRVLPAPAAITLQSFVSRVVVPHIPFVPLSFKTWPLLVLVSEEIKPGSYADCQHRRNAIQGSRCSINEQRRLSHYMERTHFTFHVVMVRMHDVYWSYGDAPLATTVQFRRAQDGWQDFLHPGSSPVFELHSAHPNSVLSQKRRAEPIASSPS